MFKLFQVAVLEVPKQTKKEEEDSFKKAPRIVLEPVCVIAKSEQDAAIKVAMSNATKFQGIDQDRMEVVVRPF